MKSTLIVTSSNRHMEQTTLDAIELMKRAGAYHVRQTATADVTFARNHALTMACNAIREVGPTHPIDVVLMVDDDMEFAHDSACALVQAAREKQRPCSALYVGITRRPCATKWRKDGDGKQLYLVGLGLIAIPVPALLELEQLSTKFLYGVGGEAERFGQLVEFCVSGSRDGFWLSEDFSLCERLGGVYLLPIEAGHRKTISIWPAAETLEELRRDAR
jgi:hypothetical protein